jgi:hypothetical protein
VHRVILGTETIDGHRMRLCVHPPIGLELPSRVGARASQYAFEMRNQRLSVNLVNLRSVDGGRDHADDVSREQRTLSHCESMDREPMFDINDVSYERCGA